MKKRTKVDELQKKLEKALEEYTVEEKEPEYVDNEQIVKPKILQQAKSKLMNKDMNKIRQKYQQQQDQNTYLTGVGLYEDEQQEQPVEEVKQEKQTFDEEILDYLKEDNNSMNELQELRKMMNKCKKDMNDYGGNIRQLNRLTVKATKNLGEYEYDDVLNTVEQKLRGQKNQKLLDKNFNYKK